MMPTPPPATPTTNPPLLSVRGVSKRFGSNVVLRSISIDVAEGEFLSILGESGSGKTTLLRLIAGLERCDSGEIWMSGERLDTLPPYKRAVNTVFQSYALFPHLSVFDNVAYGLRVRGTNRPEIKSQVSRALGMVKMTPFAQSSPTRISGGQQQRVALARALVNRPKLLLLDEPLSALDANLRRQMQLELKSLQREVGIAFVFVTHDQEEAMTMSDRIALLRAGELEQVATPREVYSHPATGYVAQFIGQSNLLHAHVSRGFAECAGLRWPTGEGDGPATFSLRPEVILPAAASSAADGMVRFRGRIVGQVFQGASELLQVECPSGYRLLVKVPAAKIQSDQMDLAFAAADAVRVRDTQRS